MPISQRGKVRPIEFLPSHWNTGVPGFEPRQLGSKLMLGDLPMGTQLLSRRVGRGASPDGIRVQIVVTVITAVCQALSS